VRVSALRGRVRAAFGQQRPSTNCPQSRRSSPIGGIDASWRDSYDAAVFAAIFSRANYSTGIGGNAIFCA
jgi:hypothetical protein